MNGGDITFSVNIDRKGLEKEVAKVQKDLEKLYAKRDRDTADRDASSQKSSELGFRLDEEKIKLKEYEDAIKRLKEEISSQPKGSASEEQKSRLSSLTEEYKEQKECVRQLQQEFNKTDNEVQKYEDSLADTNAQISSQEEKLETLKQQLSQAQKEAKTTGFKNIFSGAEKSMGSIEKRIKRIIRNLFLFNAISKVLRGGLQYFNRLLSTNTEFTNQVKKLRGALATAFQPLYEVAVPVLTYIVKLLTTIVTVIAKLTNALFGKSTSQSASNAKALNAQADALKNVGGAAKDAEKSLLSFDEINNLTEDTSGGGGSSKLYDFSGFTDELTDVESRIARVLAGVAAVAAGLKLWTLSQKFGGALGTVLKYMAAIALMVGGCILLYDGFKDALENGFDVTNLVEITLGFLAIGAAISLITGGWIPLLIAALAVGVLWLSYFTGHGEELMDNLKLAFQGFKDFFSGKFSEGWDEIVSGWSGVVDTEIESIKDLFNKFFAWCDEKTGNTGGFTKLGEIFGDFIDLILGAFTGDNEKLVLAFLDTVEDIGDAILILFGIDTTMKDLVGPIKEKLDELYKWWYESSPGQIITDITSAILSLFGIELPEIGDIFAPLREKFDELATWWNDNVVPALNKMIEGWNTFKSYLGLSSSSSRTSGSHTGKSGTWGSSSGILSWVQDIPWLAQGAVIPPNSPFMAMLGDQRSGTNIEAPLSTIQEAVAAVINQDMLYTAFAKALQEAELGVYLDGKEVTDTVTRNQRRNARAYGV